MHEPRLLAFSMAGLATDNRKIMIMLALTEGLVQCRPPYNVMLSLHLVQ